MINQKFEAMLQGGTMVMALMLMGAGCSQKASVSTDTTVGTNAVPSTIVSEDFCNNPYFGFTKGLSVTYGSTPYSENSEFTTSVISLSGNTTQIRGISGDTINDLELNCADGSKTITRQDEEYNEAIVQTVVASSGTFMPHDARVGSTWSYSRTLKTESPEYEALGMGSLITIETEQGLVVAEETVTVPAGTYKAIKVELTSTSSDEFTGTSETAKLMNSSPTTSKSTEWLVKDIGMVKSVTTSEDESWTTEAKSITGL